MVEASAGLRNRGGRLREDLQQKYAGVDCRSNDEITTFMIKNTPRRYTDDALMLELSNFLGSDSYDFLYMPWDTKRAHNVGYAFVNFVDADTARKCSALLDGQNWRLVQSPKAIKLIPAHVQGLVLNLVHYVGSSVAEGHTHAPMVIQNGQRIEFHQAVEMFCPKDMVMRQLAKVEAARLADPEASLASLASLQSRSVFSEQSISSSVELSQQGFGQDAKSLGSELTPHPSAFHSADSFFQQKCGQVSILQPERRRPSDPHAVAPVQAQSRLQWADRPGRAQERSVSDIGELHVRFMEQAKSQTGKMPAMSPQTINCLFSDHWGLQKHRVTQVETVKSVDSYFQQQGPQADSTKMTNSASFSQSETGVRSGVCEDVLGTDSYMQAWQQMNAQLEALAKSGSFGKLSLT